MSAFDPKRHCGARRQSCDRSAHAADFDGNCQKLGQPGHEAAACRRTKGWGTSHTGTGRCKHHGGSTRDGARHAAKEAAAQALELLGVSVDIDPRRALLQMVSEAWGNKIFLLDRARELKFDLTGYVQRDTKDGDLYDSSEEVRAIVRLYGEWSDRVVKYSKAAVDAGIAEARLELERRTVEVIVNVVNRSLEAAKVTPAQREAAVKAAVSELRLLEAVVPVGSNN